MSEKVSRKTLFKKAAGLTATAILAPMVSRLPIPRNYWEPLGGYPRYSAAFSGIAEAAPFTSAIPLGAIPATLALTAGDEQPSTANQPASTDDEQLPPDPEQSAAISGPSTVVDGPLTTISGPSTPADEQLPPAPVLHTITPEQLDAHAAGLPATPTWRSESALKHWIMATQVLPYTPASEPS